MSGFAEGTPTETIELGGKSYTLGFTLGAMRRAKDLGVLHRNAENETDLMLALPEYVWSCLSEEGRAELSVAKISELMNPVNVAVIAEAVGQLFTASVPKPDPNAQPAAATEPTAGNLNSKNSGQLASTI